MLRVGYPAILATELLRDLPPEVELIPLSNDIDREIEIDVWIPDPYQTRAIKVWPHLRGVRLIGIDSAATAMPVRSQMWQRLATDLHSPTLTQVAHTVPFAGLPKVFPELLQGKLRGRSVVEIKAPG